MFNSYPGKWIVAISGQNDSMALLHMCLENKMDIHLCVIHYHMRAEADAEVNYIEELSKKHHIPCDVIHAPKFKNNFQQKARDFRYQAFATLVKQHHAQGVLVGHHYDDHLETILWQKNRKHRVQHYGLLKKTTLHGVLIVRPLLSYTKEQLLDYNKKHHVVFFEDASNQDINYTRNKLRKQLDRLSTKEKQNIESYAIKMNIELKAQRKRLQKWLNDSLLIDNLLILEAADQLELLWMYLSNQNYPHSISKKNLLEIIEQLRFNPIGVIPLKDNYVLSFSNNVVSLKTRKNCEFEYTFDTIKPVTTKYFTIKLQSDTLDGVYVHKDDFPIVIRNFQAGDKIQCEFGHQKLTTWFNQRKIPWLERQCWPVVLNKNNEIIYVVGWRCDINHSTNNPNLFMIK